MVVHVVGAKVVVAVVVVVDTVVVNTVGIAVDRDILVVVVIDETSAVEKQRQQSLLVALSVVGMTDCLDVEMVVCVVEAHDLYLDVLQFQI